ncbi:hypothetical protein EYC98_04930 [Halieaceae bacterium IMCC14734]|uniref:Universal stress protein n=1 Tax=Candidatus Litorirhabdus singularis TaxID=2518993 RepID=A0ABT3TEG0_9GAMM|nr:hypothetical protein [Candidatus Litorirhabdus singularis]
MIEKPDKQTREDASAEVLVVVDTHCQWLVPVELAVTFAAARSASLRGIFVDDAQLQRVAELPFAREVTLLGAQPRALGQKQLSRSMLDVSQRFQRLLSERAQPLAVAYSFAMVSDRQQALAMALSQGADLLIIGQPRVLPLPTSRPLRVLLLPAASGDLLSALAVLLDLEPDRPAEVLVVEAQRGDSCGEQLACLRQRFAFMHTREADAEALHGLLNATGQNSLDYVLVARLAPAELLAQVLNLASCPILVTA